MKTLLISMLLSYPTWADVGPKDIPKDPPKVPEVENIGTEDYQSADDQIRGTEREKHQRMEEQMRKDLIEPDDDFRMQKDY